MKTIVKVLLRGLAVVLPVIITIAVLAWVGSYAESILGDLIARALKEHYVPGMGIVAGLALVLVVGILMSFWVFEALFKWMERQLARVPLIRTLYSSIKDLMQFFPGGQKGGPGFKQVVLANVAGVHLIGMVTREDFSDLPTPLQRRDEVLVWLPLSYQIGGFTVWMPRSAVTPIDLTIAEAMRFSMTAGITTQAAAPPAARTDGSGDPPDNREGGSLD